MAQQQQDRRDRALSEQYKSKRDLYDVMTNHMVSAQPSPGPSSSHLVFLQQQYLPEFRKCPVDFIHSILGSRARVFQNSQVVRLRVPEWPEVSIRLVMPVALEVPRLRQYLPESWPDRPDKVDRQFFWDVLATLDRQFVVDLLADVGEQRQERQREVGPEQPQIDISPEWAEALAQLNYQSS